jgi:hypothetical protein
MEMTKFFSFQEWMEKAKVMNACGEDIESKKRKRDDDQENLNNTGTEVGANVEKPDIMQVKKKPAMSGKCKLASFAFSK